MDGNWTARALASARVERRVGDRATLGIAALGTAGSDSLPGFERADVKDRSFQVNAYGRTMLSSSLRAAAFAGYGRAWYSFDLENDGLELTGEATGKRYLVGAALSGDVRLAGTTITTDAVYTKAVEELGSARLDASAGGESRADIGFALGQVDISRLSVPVHVPLVFDHPLDGRNATRLDVSPGLVCQDTSADTSSSDCGYQLGLRFQIAPTLRSSLRGEARLEAIDGFMQNQFTVSYERRILPDKPLSIGLDLGGTTGPRTDGRIMARLGIKP